MPGPHELPPTGSAAPLCEPVTEALRSYPVKIDGPRVFVRVDMA